MQSSVIASVQNEYVLVFLECIRSDLWKVSTSITRVKLDLHDLKRSMDLYRLLFVRCNRTDKEVATSTHLKKRAGPDAPLMLL